MFDASHIIRSTDTYISKPGECKALTWQAWMSASITNMSSHNYVPGEQAMTGMNTDGIVRAVAPSPAGPAMAGPFFAAGTEILNIEDMHFKHTF